MVPINDLAFSAIIGARARSIWRADIFPAEVDLGGSEFESTRLLHFT
jgi:hypothetical protein